MAKQQQPGQRPAVSRHGRQREAFRYLKSLAANTRFTARELAAATGWKRATVRTHVAKHYQGWVEPIAGDTYKILPAFKRISEEQFLGQSRQARRPASAYRPLVYRAMSVFELLVPVSRETQVRAALDELFFEDTLVQRFDELGARRLGQMIARGATESDEEYRQRSLGLVADYFGGYSVALLAGRFRGAPLLTRTDAVELQRRGTPYLVDETTASLRFIVPLATSRDATTASTQLPLPTGKTTKDEARAVRALFFALFVEAVIRTVASEVQLWLVEDSPLGRQLHAWPKGYLGNR